MTSEFVKVGEQSLPNDFFEGMVRSEPFRKAVAGLTQFVLNAEGAMTLEADALVAMRDSPGRAKIMDELVGAICPPTPSIVAWKAWLSGGADPTEAFGFNRPMSTKRASKDFAERADKARASLLKKVDEARLKAEVAQEALRRAELQVEFQISSEKADLMWRIADTLAGIIQPTFALGPAWTVMRSLSGFITDEELERAANFALSVEDREESKLEAAETKKTETGLMMEVLDTYCGDPAFERQIREAIMSVVTRYKVKEPEPTGPIFRRRGKQTMRGSVQRAGQKHREEILESFLSDRP